MSPESIYIKIHKVDNVRHAYLGLEGTILLFGQRQAATDSEMQIPVEQVAVSEGRRLKGMRLIAALLSLPATMLAVGLLYGLASRYMDVERPNTVPAIVVLLLLLVMFVAGLVAFVVGLVVFLCKVKTVRLKVVPTGATIEFYKHRKQAGEIDDFLEQLRQRQGLVDEPLAALVRRPMGFTTEHSVVPKLAASLYLSVLPAVVTQRPALLVLSLPVLAWFGYQQVQYRRQPREFRQAVRSYLHGDFEIAINALQRLRGRLADYVPAYFLLAEVFTRAGKFEEALDVASCLAADYPDLAEQMQSDIWLFKRIHQRRYTDWPGSSDGVTLSS